MVKRKHIGIFLDDRSNWTGGEYYLRNIIKALSLVPEKPLIILLYSQDQYRQKFDDFLAENIVFYKIDIKLGSFWGLYNKGMSFLRFYNLKYKKKIHSQFAIDFIYPANPNIKMINCKKEFFWIPDFQELYFPEFFNKWEIRQRKKTYDSLNSTKANLVLSSNSAKNDYNQLTPGNGNPIKVLNFRSILNISLNDIFKDRKKDYNYFVVCNQFWFHKNHKVVIEAMKIAKENNDNNFKIYFTGTEDKKNPEHLKHLKQLVIDHKLVKDVYFLGFIDRLEQLTLMANANAVIQPSFFEGWNTSIEESKYIGANLIVSDIPVHREQAEEYSITFFNPYDANDLYQKMKNAPEQFKNREIDYKKKIDRFSSELYNLDNPIANI